MSLSLALSSAISGLNVNQRALAVVSQNIANANTEGYSRKIVEQQSEVLVNGDGVGARVIAVTRYVDEYLQKVTRDRSADVGSANAINDYLQRLQIVLGEPGGANSIDEHITSYFNALQSLAETPERSSFRVGVVQAGINLAQSIADVARSMETLRWQADKDIEATATNINNVLEKLYDTNTLLNEAKAYNNEVTEIFDQRDRLLSELSGYIDAQPVFQADGQVYLYTRGGQSLLDAHLHALDFKSAESLENMAYDATLEPVLIYQLDEHGNYVGRPQTLITGGVEDEINSTAVRGGSLRGYLDIRDNIMPGFLDQLDSLAASLRDEMNAIHNAGSAFPGDSSYTGTRPVSAAEYTGWEGQVTLAVLNEDGTPVASRYADDRDGLMPLTIDLNTLNGGAGAGKPSVQSIIDEINSYFGAPQNRIEMNNLYNIEMAAQTQSLPNSGNDFIFDFDLTNLSGVSENFFMLGMTVRDDTNADITAGSSTVPSFSLAGTGTYATTINSNTVSVTAAAAHGLTEGDVIYLGQPSGAVNGIPAAELTGFFTIKNVTSTGFDIDVTTDATSTGTFNESGITGNPPYDTIDSGEHRRTTANGNITADLSGNLSSEYYDITVTLASAEVGSTIAEMGTVTYRIYNNSPYMLNKRTAAFTSTGNAELVRTSDNTPYARAYLVDDQGKEIPSTGGHIGTGEGYLRIESLVDGTVIAIDSSTSQQVGLLGNAGLLDGSDRGFSHFFELNNFFESNEPTESGDTVEGSAYAMAISDRIRNNPNLVSTGTLRLSSQPTESGAAPRYTMERYVGDDDIVQQMANLSTRTLQFSAAGGLPASKLSFLDYSAEILGSIAARTVAAETDLENKEALLDNFQQRSDAISGVNLDEELANTIIYQNAYTASARVVNVVDELFDSLIGIFR